MHLSVFKSFIVSSKPNVVEDRNDNCLNIDLAILFTPVLITNHENFNGIKRPEDFDHGEKQNLEVDAIVILRHASHDSNDLSR